jgi:hypothetical protein
MRKREREREEGRVLSERQRGDRVLQRNPWSNNAPFTGASVDRTRPTFGTAGVRPALVRQQVEKILLLFLFLFLYPLRKTPLLLLLVDGDLQLLSIADFGLFYLTCRFKPADDVASSSQFPISNPLHCPGPEAES